jgi:alkyl hydroperoxide reductase subunit F
LYELIIVGGGPAGMTAAVYAARKKINTLLICKDIGGQVVTTSWIENYMGYQYVEGIELMDKFEQQLKQFPIERQTGVEVNQVEVSKGGFTLKTGSGGSFKTKSVIVATGKKPRQLNVPGEKELLGRGVSYCAICDGPLFSGETVVVAGGGNSALEAVSDLLRIAVKVYSVTEVGFTGDAVLIAKVENQDKLSVFNRYRIVEIRGSDKVEATVIESVQTGEQQVLEARGVFVEIGLIPNSSLVQGLNILNISHEIEINCKCETGIPGLFAAGDVTSTPEKQIIIAAGEGAKAALQAHRYLQRLT